jgi:hypothetical protein
VAGVGEWRESVERVRRRWAEKKWSEQERFSSYRSAAKMKGREPELSIFHKHRKSFKNGRVQFRKKSGRF